MIIGYGKIGRAFSFDPAKWGAVGGDNEPAILLHRLLAARPNDQFILLSRCTDDPDTLPANVINPWEGYQLPKPDATISTGNTSRFSVDEHTRCVRQIYNDVVKPSVDRCDELIFWAGQHGTSNVSIPKIDATDGFTNPQDSTVNYTGPQVLGINRWRMMNPTKDEVWLCSDVRNYVKARDLFAPLRMPVLSQYDQRRGGKHYQWGVDMEWERAERYVKLEESGGILQTKDGHEYKYAGLELCGLMGAVVRSDVASIPRKHRFGVIINETRKVGGKSRVHQMGDWVFVHAPAYVHGSWSLSSQQELGVKIEAVHWSTVNDLFAETKYTITTPGSGAGWATAKPWECFRDGVVCFFHPDYDDQGHILKDELLLTEWLMVESPQEMSEKMQHLDDNHDVYTAVVERQRALFIESMRDMRIVREINDRLDGRA